MNRTKFLIITRLFTAIIVFFFFTTSLYANDNDVPVTVEVIQPVNKTMEEYAKVIGNCKSEKRSSFGSRITGIIEKLLVDEGVRVKKGQVLAQLDQSDYILSLKLTKLQYNNSVDQVDKGEAEIKRTTMNLATSKKDLQRVQDLLKKGFTQQQKLDHSQNSFESAQAASIQAKIGLKILKTQVEFLTTQVMIAQKKVKDCLILAPFDGIISIRHANLGEWIKSGQPIFTIEKDNPIEVKGEISEIYLDKLYPGMPVRVVVDGLYSPSNNQGRSYETSLKEIGATVDPKHRTIEITVQIDNFKYQLKPGLFARMQVIFTRKEKVISIPQTSIISKPDGDHIFIIKNDRAHLQKIKTGIKDDGMVEIISGLDKKDVIVSTGQNQLSGGEKINIQKGGIF
jgi:membrane fusion protein (multidrug efflux system)